MGFGEYGEISQDVGRYGERFAQNLATNFVSQYSASDNLAFLAYYFEVTTKSKCMRSTNCGCWEMRKNVGEGGKVWGSLAKQTI